MSWKSLRTLVESLAAGNWEGEIGQLRPATGKTFQLWGDVSPRCQAARQQASNRHRQTACKLLPSRCPNSREQPETLHNSAFPSNWLCGRSAANSAESGRMVRTNQHGAKCKWTTELQRGWMWNAVKNTGWMNVKVCRTQSCFVFLQGLIVKLNCRRNERPSTALWFELGDSESLDGGGAAAKDF